MPFAVCLHSRQPGGCDRRLTFALFGLYECSSSTQSSSQPPNRPSGKLAGRLFKTVSTTSCLTRKLKVFCANLEIRLNCYRTPLLNIIKILLDTYWEFCLVLISEKCVYTWLSFLLRKNEVEKHPCQHRDTFVLVKKTLLRDITKIRLNIYLEQWLIYICIIST